MISFIGNPARDYSTIICIRLQHIHYGINGIVRFKNDACVREYVFSYEKKKSTRAKATLLQISLGTLGRGTFKWVGNV